MGFERSGFGFGVTGVELWLGVLGFGSGAITVVFPAAGDPTAGGGGVPGEKSENSRSAKFKLGSPKRGI